MARDHGGHHTAVIGGDGEIAALEQRRHRQSGPLAIDLAAADAAAEYLDRVAVAVVGAAIPILFHGAAEFRQDHDDGVVPDCSTGAVERLGEGGEPVAERAQAVGELALLVALADMRVPAAEAQERKPDIAIAGNQSSKAL